MNKLKITILLLALGSGHSLSGQLRLEDCQRQAEAHYPLSKQYGLIERARDYNLANAHKGYLPQVQLTGKATYQSDVTKLPLDLSRLGIPGLSIPTMSKEQYGLSLDVSQTLWDGGAIKSQKALLRATAEEQEQSLKVQLYALRERVNQLYFGILLSEARIRQNRMLQDQLLQNEERLCAYQASGLAAQADVEALRVDRLRAIQQEAELRHQKRAYVSMLGALIGQELGEDTEWVKPEVLGPRDWSIRRPELARYDAELGRLKVQQQQITASLLPRLGLFATGGYGKPGLNMLENKAAAYYIAGVRLTWQLGNFYTQSNSRKLLRVQEQGVEQQRASFLLNTQLDIARQRAEIDQYEDKIRYDDEIIALRTNLRRAAEARLEGGTYSGIDLARDIRAEQLAIEDKILHEMQYLLSLYNLKYLTNH